MLKDKRVHVYTWNGNTLTEKLVLPESEGTITALAVSNDGALIVQGNVSIQAPVLIQVLVTDISSTVCRKDRVISLTEWRGKFC